MKRKKQGGLVYSTEHGTMCPQCNNPIHTGRCQPSTTTTTSGPVRLGRETKGRKGAGVTLVSNIPLPAAELKPLCKQLKKTCGAGGTVKDAVIEIQGDHRDTIEATLAKRGWTVKRVGG